MDEQTVGAYLTYNVTIKVPVNHSYVGIHYDDMSDDEVEDLEEAISDAAVDNPEIIEEFITGGEILDVQLDNVQITLAPL